MTLIQSLVGGPTKSFKTHSGNESSVAVWGLLFISQLVGWFVRPRHHHHIRLSSQPLSLSLSSSDCGCWLTDLTRRSNSFLLLSLSIPPAACKISALRSHLVADGSIMHLLWMLLMEFKALTIEGQKLEK